MKILLDECLPETLKEKFQGNEFDVFTAKEMNWKGKKNGKLLAIMNEHGFDVLITVDKNLPYQQNLSQFQIAVIIIKGRRNTLRALSPLVPQLLNEIQFAQKGKAVVI
jgi:predicted nuclease of predicted toxin-antitoxin system